jgi:hypothetical protein
VETVHIPKPISETFRFVFLNARYFMICNLTSAPGLKTSFVAERWEWTASMCVEHYSHWSLDISRRIMARKQADFASARNVARDSRREILGFR